MIGGGIFAANWVEVARLPLSAFCPTELCETDRLLEELINLVQRGFAPIVVNEDMCVADGNHRLAAAWLWNLFCSTSELNWDLGDQIFQLKVADFIRTRLVQPVLIHEVLDHLASLLSDSDSKQLLEESIRRHVSPSRQIESLLATLLPEYLSGAVVKAPYDRGMAIRGLSQFFTRS